jgi:aspartate racemase
MLVPDAEDQPRLNEIIFGELCRGERRPESRQWMLGLVEQLGERGAGGVILGCTEIPLVIHQQDCSLPLFNTTLLHAEKALDYAIEG